MALKTFNLDEEVYKQFSKHCKANGISMSKRIEGFIRSELNKIKKPRRRKIEGKKREDVLLSEIHSFSKYC